MRKITNDIVMPKRKLELIEALQHKKQAERVPIYKPRQPKFQSKISATRGWLVFGATVVLIFSAAWYVSVLFAFATVHITPHSQTFSVDDTFHVSNAPRTGNSNTLSLKTMRLEEAQSLTITPASSVQLDIKSVGSVTLYNKQLNVPQKLISRTRLQTPDNKIFRLTKDVIVPAGRLVQGVLVPGSIKVPAESALPGPDFNIDPSTFTLPGLAGTARVNLVYARSTQNFSGGYVGLAKSASPDELARAESSLTSALNQKLTSDAVTQTPQGYLLYKEGFFFTFEPAAVTANAQSVILRKKAVLTAILINSRELLSAIAARHMSDYKKESFSAPALASITAEVVDKASLDPSNLSNLNLRLKGSLTLISNFDSNDFRNQLAGMNSKSYALLAAKFPAIERATVELRPSWLTNFPQSSERIQVLVDTPQ